MPKTALIIEDDADIAESVKYNLESEGFSAVVASTGEQGLALALDAHNPPVNGGRRGRVAVCGGSVRADLVGEHRHVGVALRRLHRW